MTATSTSLAACKTLGIATLWFFASYEAKLRHRTALTGSDITNRSQLHA